MDEQEEAWLLEAVWIHVYHHVLHLRLINAGTHATKRGNASWEETKVESWNAKFSFVAHRFIKSKAVFCTVYGLGSCTFH